MRLHRGNWVVGMAYPLWPLSVSRPTRAATRNAPNKKASQHTTTQHTRRVCKDVRQRVRIRIATAARRDLVVWCRRDLRPTNASAHLHYTTTRCYRRLPNAATQKENKGVYIKQHRDPHTPRFAAGLPRALDLQTPFSNSQILMVWSELQLAKISGLHPRHVASSARTIRERKA